LGGHLHKLFVIPVDTPRSADFFKIVAKNQVWQRRFIACAKRQAAPQKQFFISIRLSVWGQSPTRVGTTATVDLDLRLIFLTALHSNGQIKQACNPCNTWLVAH
jgi:hypothetical protein